MAEGVAEEKAKEANTLRRTHRHTQEQVQAAESKTAIALGLVWLVRRHHSPYDILLDRVIMRPVDADRAVLSNGNHRTRALVKETLVGFFW